MCVRVDIRTQRLRGPDTEAECHQHRYACVCRRGRERILTANKLRFGAVACRSR